MSERSERASGEGGKESRRFRRSRRTQAGSKGGREGGRTTTQRERGQTSRHDSLSLSLSRTSRTAALRYVRSGPAHPTEMSLEKSKDSARRRAASYHSGQGGRVCVHVCARRWPSLRCPDTAATVMANVLHAVGRIVIKMRPCETRCARGSVLSFPAATVIKHILLICCRSEREPIRTVDSTP